MTRVLNDITCKHCGYHLKETYKGPCPRCGQKGRNINSSITEGIVVSDSINSQTIREFYEKNHKVLAIVTGITVIAPFVGFFLAGVLGVVVGLVLGVLSFFLGPRAVVKVREIRNS